MATISSMLSNFSNFLQNHQVSCVNGLLILFTVGGEQIFRFAAFQCPCSPTDARWYALSFMFGPAVALGIIGVVVNNLTWRLFHGCIHRTNNSRHGFCDSAQHCLAVLGRAAIVPFAWLFVTFLDGNYYTCMESSAPCERNSEENRRLMAQSQTISWVILVSVVGFASMVICITRCIDSVTYMQNRYVCIYREAERLHFEEIMQKTAAELAQTNIKSFMSSSDLGKQDWDFISKASKYRIKERQPGQFSYTPLHSWTQAHPESKIEQMFDGDGKTDEKSEIPLKELQKS